MEQAMHGTQPANSIAPLQTSVIRAGLAVIVIARGLCLRGQGRKVHSSS